MNVKVRAVVLCALDGGDRICREKPNILVVFADDLGYATGRSRA